MTAPDVAPLPDAPLPAVVEHAAILSPVQSALVKLAYEKRFVANNAAETEYQTVLRAVADEHGVPPLLKYTIKNEEGTERIEILWVTPLLNSDGMSPLALMPESPK